MKFFIKELLHITKLSIRFLIFLSLIFSYSNSVFSSQENYFKEMEINNTNKDGYDSSKALPTNPFEIVDMLRRVNSMNDATSPTDALDDAIKSFEDLNLKNK